MSVESAVSTLQTQNAALRQLLIIHDRLGALVLQGAEVAAITGMLADLIGRRVLLLDPLLRVVASSTNATSDSQTAAGERAASEAWTPREGYVRAVLATLGRERRPLRVPPMAHFGVAASCVLAPVAVGEDILGYLALLAEGSESGGEDVDLQIVQHAATVYALSMMRERMASEVARQLKDDVFEGLLLGRTQDEQVARERALRLGYNPSLVYRALVLVARDALRGDDPGPERIAQRHRLLESVSELCAREAKGSLATQRDDELVVLVADPANARALGQAALEHAGALLPGWRVTAGIGGACVNASAIAQSYAQARRALDTAQRFGGQGDVVAFEDLGVYRLLFHVTDPSELSGFIDQVLGPLLEYDQRHSSDFLRTLGTFLSLNGSLQATARELSLHVNSVTYRLQRIEAISGLDLERSEDRLLAQIALKILNGVAG